MCVFAAFELEIRALLKHKAKKKKKRKLKQKVWDKFEIYFFFDKIQTKTLFYSFVDIASILKAQISKFNLKKKTLSKKEFNSVSNINHSFV